MSEDMTISTDQVDALYERLNQEAEASGYHLNPDVNFTKELVEGLLINEERYGYWACPCRLADGDKQKDLDIICPCDYRDADLLDWGACYCALYVSNAVLREYRPTGRYDIPGKDTESGKELTLQPVPERRPVDESQRPQNRPARAPALSGRNDENALPVWHCRVCGYLCARERPPGVCPICKAKQDRFERFW